MPENYSKLYKQLGFEFIEVSFLEQAFVHRSYLNETKKEKMTSNERLEFLGDSILSFITSDYLFKKYPMLPEGDLTNYRSSLVCAKCLAGIASALDLGSYLKMSKGEDHGGGRQNHSLLANTVESLIGAIYLDQGIEKAASFIRKFILPELSEIIKNKSFKDYKSLFQEKVQEKTRLSPVYRVIESWGPDHNKNFKIGVFVDEKEVAEGIGKSKQEAQQEAAKAAIENWA